MADTGTASERRAKVLVHLVDGDPERRRRRAEIIDSAGYRLHAHPDNDSLLTALGSEPHWVCVVADVENPALDGRSLLAQLRQERVSLPVILIDGDTSVSTVGRLFRDGAADYLVRPVPAATLVEAIEDAVALQGEHGLWTGLPADRAERLASLTPAERRVMDAILHGATTRGVAEAFGISARTVEVHRNRVFVKLGAANLAQLVRIVVSDFAHAGAARASGILEAAVDKVEAAAGQAKQAAGDGGARIADGAARLVGEAVGGSGDNTTGGDAAGDAASGRLDPAPRPVPVRSADRCSD